MNTTSDHAHEPRDTFPWETKPENGVQLQSCRSCSAHRFTPSTDGVVAGTPWFRFQPLDVL